MTTYPNRIEMLRQTVPPNSVGAEIGVFRGDFSAQILEVVKPRKLFLIDPWQFQDGEYALDPSNLKQEEQEWNYGHVLGRFDKEILSGQVDVIRKHSQAASAFFAVNDLRLDWIYLDAGHYYKAVMEDLLGWFPRIVVDGSIFGHDYCTNSKTVQMGFKVVEAVHNFCIPAKWKMVAITDEEWPSFQLKRV